MEMSLEDGDSIVPMEPTDIEQLHSNCGVVMTWLSNTCFERRKNKLHDTDGNVNTPNTNTSRNGTSIDIGIGMGENNYNDSILDFDFYIYRYSLLDLRDRDKR